MSEHEFAGHDNVTLRGYVEALFEQKDKALDAALAAQKEAVVKAEVATDRIAARAQADQEALRDQMAERLTALRRELENAVATQKEAVAKAETATDRRLEGMNEFRDALTDQSNQMMPRREFEAQHSELVRQLSELRSSVADLRTSVAVGPQALAVLEKDAARNVGHQAGNAQLLSYVFQVVTFLIAIAAVVALVAHG